MSKFLFFIKDNAIKTAECNSVYVEQLSTPGLQKHLFETEASNQQDA